MKVRQDAGFTLLEVLVSIAIVSVAVFPLLQISQEAEQAAFEAKFDEVACSRIRAMLSYIAAKARPGETSEGDFSTMSEDEGFDERFSYSSIRYEWEVEAHDLSSDLLPGDEEDDDDLNFDEPEDEDIDERFRARYVKIRVYFEGEEEEESEIIVETFLPPLPSDADRGGYQQNDLRDPNRGG